MNEEQLDALGSALEDFLHPYLFCCGYTQTFTHLHTYCRGLLSDLPRKTVEPIALASGCAVRTLQEFLKDHRWDSTAVRQLLQRHLAATLPSLPADDLGTVGLIDETSALKSGTKTPGVQRQYLGCVGKIANASSPSTSASAEAATRRCAMPSCFCPRTGRRTALAASPPASPKTWSIVPSGGLLWRRWIEPWPTPSTWSGREGTCGGGGGAAQPHLLATAMAEGEAGAADGRTAGLGSQGGAGLASARPAVERANLLVAVGQERRQRGGEILVVQGTGQGTGADAGACGVPALERGTGDSAGQERDRFDAR
jgi:hypothetical protein